MIQKGKGVFIKKWDLVYKNLKETSVVDPKKWIRGTRSMKSS